MNSREICRLAERLMRHPAAPYFEHAVRTEVEAICAEHGLKARRDEFGNVIVRLRKGRGGRPLVLAAHMDHPGFEILKRPSRGRILVRFQGGVGDSYFRSGIGLRLMPGGLLAKLGKRRAKAGEKVFEVKVGQPRRLSGLPQPSFAVWDLEDFAVRGGRIYGRACDDLIGVAAILATMIELERRRVSANVIGVISRAEEVGLQGAIAIAAARGLPGNSLVISLETSRELPGVKMGEGVILRVGDRTSVFDEEATRFLMQVAWEGRGGTKAARHATQQRISWQRALMSGGTCEATAYQEFGFQTAAVCVALGNYHNCAAANRIREEYVSVADVCSMVDNLVAAARAMPRYTALTGRLGKRLRQMLATGRRRLQATR